MKDRQDCEGEGYVEIKCDTCDGEGVVEGEEHDEPSGPSLAEPEAAGQQRLITGDVPA